MDLVWSAKIRTLSFFISYSDLLQNELLAVFLRILRFQLGYLTLQGGASFNHLIVDVFFSFKQPLLNRFNHFFPLDTVLQVFKENSLTMAGCINLKRD